MRQNNQSQVVICCLWYIFCCAFSLPVSVSRCIGGCPQGYFCTMSNLCLPCTDLCFQDGKLTLSLLCNFECPEYSMLKHGLVTSEDSTPKTTLQLASTNSANTGVAADFDIYHIRCFSGKCPLDYFCSAHALCLPCSILCVHEGKMRMTRACTIECPGFLNTPQNNYISNKDETATKIPMTRVGDEFLVNLKSVPTSFLVISIVPAVIFLICIMLWFVLILKTRTVTSLRRNSTSIRCAKRKASEATLEEATALLQDDLPCLLTSSRKSSVSSLHDHDIELFSNENVSNNCSVRTQNNSFPKISTSSQAERCSPQCCQRSDKTLTSNLDCLFSNIIERSRGIVPEGITNIQFCRDGNLIALIVETGKEAVASNFIKEYLCQCFYTKHFKLVSAEPPELLGCPICKCPDCPSSNQEATAWRLNSWIGPGSVLQTVLKSNWEKINEQIPKIDGIEAVRRWLQANGGFHKVEEQWFSVGCCMKYEGPKYAKPCDVIVTCSHAIKAGLQEKLEMVFLTEVLVDNGTKLVAVGIDYLGYCSHSFRLGESRGNYAFLDALVIFVEDTAKSFLKNKIKPVCTPEYELCDSAMYLFEDCIRNFSGTFVTKSGGATGHTYGQAFLVDDNYYTDRSAAEFKETFQSFHVQSIYTGHFSDKGDSGSVVVEATDSPKSVWAYGIVIAKMPVLDSRGNVYQDAVQCISLSHTLSYFRDSHGADIYFPESRFASVSSALLPPLPNGEQSPDDTVRQIQLSSPVAGGFDLARSNAFAPEPENNVSSIGERISATLSIQESDAVQQGVQLLGFKQKAEENATDDDKIAIITTN